MPCGCQGGSEPPSIPVTSGDLTQASSRATPGMPRYKVVGGDADAGKTFDTYGAARVYKQETGGRIRSDVLEKPVLNEAPPLHDVHRVQEERGLQAYGLPVRQGSAPPFERPPKGGDQILAVESFRARHGGLGMTSVSEQALTICATCSPNSCWIRPSVCGPP